MSPVESKSKSSQKDHSLLVEVAWEVANQVGGIYTVIRSKAPEMIKNWGDRYCMVGPLLDKNIYAEVEEIKDGDDPYFKAALLLQEKGIKIFYGTWLVTGRPKVVLLDPQSIEKPGVDLAKYKLWETHNIGTSGSQELISNVVVFGSLVLEWFEALRQSTPKARTIIGHFHEWMAGLPILDIKKKKIKVKTIFTTHATILGRHLAINSPQFYAHLPFFNWEDEARRFGIEPESRIEHACARDCDLLTTVSEVTARECKHLLKRKADGILPNGLNIERFTALHEFQNLHATFKEEIHQFVMGHFFQSYSFDLDKTLYCFTSGRYEYKNKGFDLTLDALDQLNERLKREKSDITVVMFFVTKQPFKQVNSEVLHNRAVMEDIRKNCVAIQKQVGRRLFYASTILEDHKLPELNQFVDDYWRLRYRRTIQSWKTDRLPRVVTHDLIDEKSDEIISFLKSRGLKNRKEDRVKIVYHPDFINPISPLFAFEYDEFVRGCHLGIFPSFYEPWGYTPLECMARGVPAVTSDLSGFGDYILQNMPDHEKHGLFVVERGKRSYEWSSRQLAGILHNFVKLTRRERIALRNFTENKSDSFDWKNLIMHYEEQYKKLI